MSGPLTTALVGAGLAGLFTCIDTALTSVSTARLSALAKQAQPRFQPTLERVATRRETTQARYLSGRILALSLYAGGVAMLLIGLHQSTLWKIALALVAITTIGWIGHSAAALGRHAADWVITYGLYLSRPLELLLAPLCEIMRAVPRLLPALRQQADPLVTETEVEIMVDESEKSGSLKPDPAELIRNVLEFSELSARDAMVPRTRVTAIKLDTPLEDVLQTIGDTGHSRYPVYREDIDDVFGLLYAKDVFRVLKSSWHPPSQPGPNGDGETPSRRAARLLDIVREPIKIVSESHPLSNLLREMRQDRQHLAVVVDEFGGFSGVVTLEDILEEIVGDIQDEHDIEEAPIVEVAPGRLMADAAVDVSDLSAYLGSDLDPEGQYDSLGGMLTDKVGGVPTVGTSIPVFGLRFIVRESDAKHISKVEIVRPGMHADASGPHSNVS
jgi:CBS domain containing-hemolysin-like protein